MVITSAQALHSGNRPLGDLFWQTGGSQLSVLCFGELLLRFCPDAGGDWANSGVMNCYIGGAEGNVARNLARWNMQSAFMTALPDNYLSRQLTARLEHEGVDTERTEFRGDRIGIFYLPQGGDMKHAEVIYDRKHSSFSDLLPGQIDWVRQLQGVGWLHMSAISPALNPQLSAVCLEAARQAVEMGIPFSLDLNYREKLWTGREPRDVLPELVAHASVIMGNVWSSNRMLGTARPYQPVESGDLNKLEHEAGKCSAEIFTRFPNVEAVALTFRMESEKGMHYHASLQRAGKGICHSSLDLGQKTFYKVGSGDCFMSGLIYGFASNFSDQQILNFASAAAVLKLGVETDITQAAAADILTFMKQNYEKC